MMLSTMWSAEPMKSELIVENHNHSTFCCHEHDHVVETTGLDELVVDAFEDLTFEVIRNLCDKILGCGHVVCHDLCDLH